MMTECRAKHQGTPSLINMKPNTTGTLVGSSAVVTGSLTFVIKA